MSVNLNDAPPQREQRPEYDLDDLSARLGERAREWVPELFPRGRIVDNKLRLANIRGDAPKKEGSCVIEMKGAKAGYWHDFGTNKGGGPLSTLSEALNLHGQELIARAAEMVGSVPRLANGHDRSNRKDEQAAREIVRIESGCVPLAGTEGETYLKSRLLADPGSPDLLFNPELTDYKRQRVRPGIVAIVRRGDTGERTGGIHRTFLADDGTAKSADMPNAKMMLGPCAGGAVQLFPMGEDGVLGVAEGIETALAAHKLFGVPVWPTLSTSGTKTFVSPPNMKRLMIFADRGTHDGGGESAAWHLFGRAKMAGIEAEVYLPRSDDDFAKDLELGLWNAEDATIAPVPEPTAPTPEPEIIPPTPARMPAYEETLAEAERLSRDSSIPEIEMVLRASLRLGPLPLGQVLLVVKKKTGWPLGKLNEIVKLMRSEAKIGALGEGSRAVDIGSDVEIAQRVAKELRNEVGEIVYDDGDFCHHNGAYWEAIEWSDARRAVHRFDGATYTSPAGTDMAVQLSKTRIDSVLNEMGATLAQSDFFKHAPAGINCASGFIAFDAAGQPSLVDHHPSHRCRHALPGRWSPGGLDGENPPLDSLLGRLLYGSFKNDEDAEEKRRLLAEVAGAAALGYGPKLRQPKAVVFVGETAENGKSQVLDAIRGLLPESAISSITANKFGEDRYIVGLRGKLLNAADELSGAAIASEAFKAVVTGNPVCGRDVYRSAIDFRPVAQHIFATNTLPRFAGGMDRGVRRRLLPVVFNRVIPVDERIEDIGLRIGCEEADLMLAFAVAGASRLIRQRGFTVPKSSREALQSWVYQDNLVLAWVDARVDPDPPRPGMKVCGIKSSYAYSMFRKWAIEEGFAERYLPDLPGFVQRLKQNTTVPDIKVRHTRNGNLLIGLKILATDRHTDAGDDADDYYR